MSKTRFKMTIYHVEALPQEMRESFRLPAYPFAESEVGPLPEDVRSYFEQYSIVFYRDELNPYGIMCEPKDGDPTLLVDRVGWSGHRSSVELLWRGMGPYRWESTRDPEKYRRIVRRHGDDCAWITWNKEVIILKMHEKSVTTS